MSIDTRSGRITWTPTESQGPGEYRVTATAVASAGPAPAHASCTFRIAVEEVNQPPWIKPVSSQVLRAEETDTLRLKVQATDPDLPSRPLVYFLATGCPDGVRIDAETGELTWTPTAEQRGREHSITVGVREEGPGAKSDQTQFTVNITQVDAWTTMARRVAPAVCLLLAIEPKSGSAFPYGCGCAIRDDAVLTSATLAVELEKRRQSGWQIQANWPQRERTSKVRGIRVHRAFTATARTPVEQIYWDLAILTVDDSIADVAQLAGPQDLSSLEPGLPLGCLAIEHTAEPLTRFDTPRVQLSRIKLLAHDPLASPGGEPQPGAPELLFVSGSLPDRIHGSPIVNEAGNIVGVYAEKAYTGEDNANQPSNMHYAPETTLVRAWLAGQGTDHWDAPEWQNQQ
jgi:hypothetical protein